MNIRKRNHFLNLVAGMLLVLVLLVSSNGLSLAQQPGPDELTSQQPFTPVETVQPELVSPWGPQSPLTPPGTSAAPNKQYVAATWGDNAVHFLDSDLNDTGSFTAGDSQPNGIASDGIVIYTGHFLTQSVRIFDYSGNLLFTWSDARLNALQGLEYVDGELAVYSAFSDQVYFFVPATGAYLRSIPGQGNTTEALAYDGVLLWLLADTIIGINPADGTVIRSIPNAGIGCAYGGTGLTADAPGKLTIGCADGNWYRVSSADGSVLASGKNGLQMYGLSSSTPLQINPVYIRSTAGAPWGVTTNETAMDRVFGTGFWQDLRYETVNPNTLFSPSTSMIFMEGSDIDANELEAFLTANQTLLEDWVANGGCLLLNAAPNEGDGMSYGFGGVSLAYIYPTTQSLTGVAVDTAHPIFNGPFTPTGTSFTGSAFSHASVSGGDVINVMTGDSTNIPLAEKPWGLGHAVFGGMTTTDFHSPQPNADNLRANLLYYITTFGCGTNAPPTASDDGTLFYEDFETSYENWTMTGMWNPENQADTCGAQVIPFPSPFNAAYFGLDGTCNYNAGTVTGTLTLNNPISLPLDSSAWLTLSSYEKTENQCNSYDYRYVEISTNGGGSWITLGHLCTEGTWYTAGFDLSAYAGENILLRFRFDSIDNKANDYFGWMVDNIAIQYIPLNFITDEDSPIVTPNLLANDFDPNGDLITLESYDDSSLLGKLTSNGDGTFIYDPNGAFDYLAPNQQAVDSFTYVIYDGVYSANASVHILITGLNDAPIAVNDAYTTPEHMALNVLAPGVLINDTDPEGDPITAGLAQGPATGSLTLNPNGGFNYSPVHRFTGMVTFAYTATDGIALSSYDPLNVRFNAPEFLLGTQVDGFVANTQFGHTIPPLSFNFKVGSVPSIDAAFIIGGPGSTAYVQSPLIEGTSAGTLYVDFGADVNDASFGFAVSCAPIIANAVTVNAYDSNQTQVATVYADGISTGFFYAENKVVITPGVLFRSLAIDFIDSCGRFVIDNLTYNTYKGPTLVNITVTPVDFDIMLPVIIKMP